MRYVFVTFILLATGMASCDNIICVNRNHIFDKYNPKSREYKTELVNQLQKKYFRDVSFSIKGYEEIDSTPYMVVDIQSRNLCATGYLNIKDAERLEQFRKVKGMSYHGAGLSGLEFHIDSSNGNYNFIFDDVVWIVD